MSIWFGRLGPQWRRWPAAGVLVLGLLLAQAAHGQGTPRDSTKTPVAEPGQRPGSPPTPPVRYVSPDPRDPVGPPPAGVTNPGQKRLPGTSHKPVPDTLARPVRAGAGLTDSSLVSGAGDSLTLAARRKGAVESTVVYVAKDSIQFDVTEKVARLYSKAAVDYGAMKLKAALITVNYGTNTMTAEGRRDSVSHRLLDRPVFTDKGATYTAGSIAYNYKSKKGKVTDAVTQEGEGYVHAETIKKQADGTLHGLHGRYTTCNQEHPHFYIQASKMKVMPGEQVVTGPFNLVVGDIPTPLGFLFGFFPMQDKGRGSGVIIPTFGQAADRGYFLTNGGYYFAPNDHLGVRLTGDIYAGNGESFGGWATTADITYLTRYQYQGNFNFRYANSPNNRLVPATGLSTEPTYLREGAQHQFSVRWQHTPVPKPGGGVFSANVDAQSVGYSRRYSLDARNYLAPSFNSGITYSKQLRNAPINYRIQLGQSQNNQTGIMNFTLPEVSAGVARQFPYQWLGITPRGRFYEQFSIDYQVNAKNLVTNQVSSRTLANGTTTPLLGGTSTGGLLPFTTGNLGAILRNSQNGVQHNFGITLGSYTVAKNFKLTPTVNYGTIWYGQKLEYSYNRVAQAVRIDTIRGFNSVSSYGANLGLNTVFYGTVVLKGKKIEAIRHKVTPALSYNFNPNYRQTEFGVFQNLSQTDIPTNLRIPTEYNRFSGFVYGAPAGGLVSAVTFSLQNSVEMKVRDNKDTTGTNPFRKVSLIDALNFDIGYNFAADSQKLSNLRVTFGRRVGTSLTLSADANFSPYQRDSTGRTIDRYLFEQSNFRLARLTQASLAANFSFNPARGNSPAVIPRQVGAPNDPTLGTPGPPAMYADYVDFEIPWELTASYTASYTPSGVPLRTSTELAYRAVASSVTITGSVKLTSNLRFSYNTGYDLVSGNVTYPNVTFFRDLHCWQIAGTWIPLGITRGYNVTISAKSSLLQDLKLNRNRYQQYQ